MEIAICLRQVANREHNLTLTCSLSKLVVHYPRTVRRWQLWYLMRSRLRHWLPAMQNHGPPLTKQNAFWKVVLSRKKDAKMTTWDKRSQSTLKCKSLVQAINRLPMNILCASHAKTTKDQLMTRTIKSSSMLGSSSSKEQIQHHKPNKMACIASMIDTKLVLLNPWRPMPNALLYASRTSNVEISK